MTNSKSVQSEAAWSDFWARNAAHGQGGAAEGGGCLPARWKAIEEAQSGAWLTFAAQLEQRARLIDLATGDGRVLRWIQQARGDLRLTGVDLAPKLPPGPRGVAMHSGIAMEDLPFADNSFDAVTSQFGFEYSDVARSSHEIARILSDGGKAGILVHRGDGPILEHNLSRKEQIDWVLSEVSLLGEVKALLEEGMRTKGGVPISLQSSLDLAAKRAQEGAEKFGEGAAAWEIPEAVRRTVMMGGSSGPQSVIATLRAIGEQAGNEAGRINSLAGACKTADARKDLLAHLESAGLKLDSEIQICEPKGRAFGDFLVFSRG